jgi:dTDP-4-dehydrorhamnose 3,5-epimerase-like enzyme
MKGNTTIQPGASWSEDTLKDIIQNENIKYQEIILEKNQLLNIPRYWWHAIINLETTMAVTYHYYTASYLLFNRFL